MNVPLEIRERALDRVVEQMNAIADRARSKIVVRPLQAGEVGLWAVEVPTNGVAAMVFGRRVLFLTEAAGVARRADAVTGLVPRARHRGVLPGLASELVDSLRAF